MDAIKEGMLASAKAAEAAARVGERLFGQNTSSVMNFKSQICTDRSQSARLMKLGLKKETADMYMTPSWGGGKIIGYYVADVVILDDHFDVFPNDLPAWSLHRLLTMMPKNIAIDGDTAYPLQIQKRSDGKWCVGYQGWYDCVGDLYDSVIWIYQLLISEGYLDEFCNKD